jgi:hypothetical protein
MESCGMVSSEPTRSSHYEVNAPAVISQTIDGEAVVIDLGSGCYYGLNPAASLIWDLLGAGLSAGEIAAALAGPHLAGSPGGPAASRPAGSPAASPAEVETAVRGLVDELLREGLIRPRTGGPAADAGTAAVSPVAGAPSLAKPVITKYSDMQDLLLLDPIHEVADSGWPRKKPEQPKPAKR